LNEDGRGAGESILSPLFHGLKTGILFQEIPGLCKLVSSSLRIYGGVKVVKRLFWGLSVIVLSVAMGLAYGCCAKKPVVMSEKPAEAAVVVQETMPQETAVVEAQQKEEPAVPAGPTEIEIFELEKIYFDFDMAELKAEAREMLKKKAEWLKANPEYSLLIEGNCDERGTMAYNLALGERRAGAAMKYLVDLGVPAEKISTVSYGEEKPFDAGHDEEAWAKNRRDDFTLTGVKP